MKKISWTRKKYQSYQNIQMNIFNNLSLMTHLLPISFRKKLTVSIFIKLILMRKCLSWLKIMKLIFIKDLLLNVTRNLCRNSSQTVLSLIIMIQNRLVFKVYRTIKFLKKLIICQFIKSWSRMNLNIHQAQEATICITESMGSW